MCDTVKQNVQFISPGVAAYSIIQSERGQILISRAIYTLIKELEKVTGIEREESDIDDLKLLQEKVFPQWPSIQRDLNQYKEE